jgi:hypothetical protein
MQNAVINSLSFIPEATNLYYILQRNVQFEISIPRDCEYFLFVF